MKQRSHSTTLAALALMLGLAACQQSEPGDAPKAPAGQSEKSAAPVIDADEIPTQAEADAAAAKKIDQQNAQAELEKLKSELGGG